VRTAADGLAAVFDAGPARAAGCERLGPAPAPLARLRGRYRYQLLVKGPADPVHDAARELARALATLPEGVQGTVDALPMSML
jgi:primosomal protein N' (replication factor Y)